MFRLPQFRSKTASSDASVADTDGESGKGRATPSRRQAETDRKERLKASARGTTTKSGRSSGSSSSGSSPRAARAELRKRMIAGDESALAPRDRGPAKRYARDLVDSRRTVGQYFLYLAVAALVLSLAKSHATRLVEPVLLGIIVLALIIDSLLIRRSVTRAVQTRFPNEDLTGIGAYAMKRAMSARKLRVPSPRVGIGPLEPPR